jgi:hypothetical protein
MPDTWTDAFAVPGKHASGTGAGHFALFPSSGQRELPAEVQRIDAPTLYVWTPFLGDGRLRSLNTGTSYLRTWAMFSALADGPRSPG